MSVSTKAGIQKHCLDARLAFDACGNGLREHDGKSDWTGIHEALN
jgi:hypothetical protein